jgi:hypothetical protein
MHGQEDLSADRWPSSSPEELTPEAENPMQAVEDSAKTTPEPTESVLGGEEEEEGAEQEQSSPIYHTGDSDPLESWGEGPFVYDVERPTTARPPHTDSLFLLNALEGVEIGDRATEALVSWAVIDRFAERFLSTATRDKCIVYFEDRDLIFQWHL